MVTLPMTDAEGAMKLLAPGSAGATPSTDTIRVEGTKRSVYLATSMLAPMLSRAALCDELFWEGQGERGERMLVVCEPCSIVEDADCSQSLDDPNLVSCQGEYVTHQQGRSCHGAVGDKGNAKRANIHVPINYSLSLARRSCLLCRQRFHGLKNT